MSSRKRRAPSAAEDEKSTKKKQKTQPEAKTEQRSVPCIWERIGPIPALDRGVQRAVELVSRAATVASLAANVILQIQMDRDGRPSPLMGTDADFYRPLLRAASSVKGQKLTADRKDKDEERLFGMKLSAGKLKRDSARLQDLRDLGVALEAGRASPATEIFWGSKKALEAYEEMAEGGDKKKKLARRIKALPAWLKRNITKLEGDRTAQDRAQMRADMYDAFRLILTPPTQPQRDKELSRIPALLERHAKGDTAHLEAAFRDTLGARSIELPDIPRTSLEPLTSALARSMTTNFTVGVQEHLFKRQHKVVYFQVREALPEDRRKEAKRLAAHVCNALNGYEQKAELSEEQEALVQRVRDEHLPHLPAFEDRLSKAEVGNRAPDFLPYMQYLSGVCFATHERKQGEGDRLRGFSTLPFFKLSARFIPVTRHTISSLLALGGLSSKQRQKLVCSIQDPRTDAELLAAFFPKLARDYSQRALRFRLAGRERFYVTTDGVSARLSFKTLAREEEEEEEEEDEASGAATSTEHKDEVGQLALTPERMLLQNAIPGDGRSGFRQFPTGTVATGMVPTSPIYLGVDPGHANIITVAGLHTPAPPAAEPPPPRRLSKRARKREQTRRKRLAEGVSFYTLKNTTYAKLTKRRVTAERARQVAYDTGANIADAILSAYPVHAPSLEGALAHARVYLTLWPVLEARAFHPTLRRDRLTRFRYTQRAASKIATQIRAAVRAVVGSEERLRGRLVLVWGNGSFRPTSRGHAAAPNKALRKQLRAHFPIVLCSEYRTSQVCGAVGCAGEVVHEWKLRHKEATRKTPVRGRFRCEQCHTMWSRDLSSALSILKIWRYQCAHATLERPPAYRVQPRAAAATGQAAPHKAGTN